MYRLEHGSHGHDYCRLISDTVLTATDFNAIARDIGTAPILAQKVGLVSARIATTPGKNRDRVRRGGNE